MESCKFQVSYGANGSLIYNLYATVVAQEVITAVHYAVRSVR